MAQAISKKETTQTAVDWLVEKFNQCEPMYSGIISLEHKKYLDGLIQQALAMEQQKIENAWVDAKISMINKEIKNAEEYYNQTYENL